MSTGYVATALSKEYGPVMQMANRTAQFLLGRDTIEGAQTSIYTAVSTEAGKSTDQHWDSLKVQTPNKIALVPENLEKILKGVG